MAPTLPSEPGSDSTQGVSAPTHPLLHVTTPTAWASAQGDGALRPSSLAEVGFIHLCTQDQLEGVLERFFRGQSDLLLLQIDPGALSAPLKWEAADGDRFPHLYGPLPVDAVIGVRPLPPMR